MITPLLYLNEGPRLVIITGHQLRRHARPVTQTVVRILVRLVLQIAAYRVCTQNLRDAEFRVVSHDQINPIDFCEFVWGELRVAPCYNDFGTGVTP